MQTFHLASDEQIDTRFMRQVEEFRYHRAEGCQVVELPYIGGDTSMLIVVPDEVDGLAAIEERLAPELLDTWIAGLAGRKIDLLLPRWSTRARFELVRGLQALGMRSAFSPAADFSGMRGRRDLFIGQVIHEAWLKVIEQGTEAPAATAVVMRSGLPAPAQPTVLRVDRPFLYCIRHRPSGSILFMGRVNEAASFALGD